MRKYSSRGIRSLSCSAAALLLVLIPTAGKALPNPITSCPGAPITTDTSLGADLHKSGPGACIVIVADNVTLFLNGHNIDITGAGNNGIAIIVAGHTNVLIKGPGKILAHYTYIETTAAVPTAIRVQGNNADSVEIHGVTVLNQVGDPTCPPVPFGIGIEIAGSGGNIHNNTVSCFQAGIDILMSSPIVGGNAGFNTVTMNHGNLELGEGIQLVGSFGIGLRGSSNWTINGNTVQNNGASIAVAPVSNDRPETVLSGGIVLESPTLLTAPTQDPPTTGSNNNVIVRNIVMDNSPFGIAIAFGGSHGNVIVNNTSHNNGIDMADFTPLGNNTWVNDRCTTQEGTGVPPGFCH